MGNTDVCADEHNEEHKAWGTLMCVQRMNEEHKAWGTLMCVKRSIMRSIRLGEH